MSELKCFNFLKIGVFSFALLAMFLITSDLFAHPNHSKYKELSLCDFEGGYSVFAQSVGGVDGTSGSSNTALGHVTFDDNGIGISDYYSKTTYTGPIGTPLQTTTLTPPTGIFLKINLAEAKFGIGTITMTVASTGEVLTLDFVATTVKGKVVKLNGHLIQQQGKPTTYSATYTFERRS